MINQPGYFNADADWGSLGSSVISGAGSIIGTLGQAQTQQKATDNALTANLANINAQLQLGQANAATAQLQAETKAQQSKSIVTAVSVGVGILAVAAIVITIVKVRKRRAA